MYFLVGYFYYFIFPNLGFNFGLSHFKLVLKMTASAILCETYSSNKAIKRNKPDLSISEFQILEKSTKSHDLSLCLSKWNSPAPLSCK